MCSLTSGPFTILFNACIEYDSLILNTNKARHNMKRKLCLIVYHVSLVNSVYIYLLLSSSSCHATKASFSLLSANGLYNDIFLIVFIYFGLSFNYSLSRQHVLSSPFKIRKINTTSTNISVGELKKFKFGGERIT